MIRNKNDLMIQGFADSVGLEQMQYLLQDVGFPYNATTALAELE